MSNNSFSLLLSLVNYFPMCLSHLFACVNIWKMNGIIYISSLKKSTCFFTAKNLSYCILLQFIKDSKLKVTLGLQEKESNDAEIPVQIGNEMNPTSFCHKSRVLNH